MDILNQDVVTSDQQLLPYTWVDSGWLEVGVGGAIGCLDSYSLLEISCGVSFFHSLSLGVFGEATLEFRLPLGCRCLLKLLLSFHLLLLHLLLLLHRAFHWTAVLNLLRRLNLIIVWEGDDLIGEKTFLNQTIYRFCLLKVFVINWGALAWVDSNEVWFSEILGQCLTDNVANFGIELRNLLDHLEIALLSGYVVHEVSVGCEDFLAAIVSWQIHRFCNLGYLVSVSLNRILTWLIRFGTHDIFDAILYLIDVFLASIETPQTHQVHRIQK